MVNFDMVEYIQLNVCMDYSKYHDQVFFQQMLLYVVDYLHLASNVCQLKYHLKFVWWQIQIPFDISIVKPT